ncbi:hypothetical protein IMG5_178390 [Ichthyophthirius multifiliis]|uniref:N-end aminoacyl transferase N-terminal domain-containing protein n=1 Tax=Ichthyophthirius multifiliis TaxID=5932 RepID=G0R2I3_ICHMU|nr:hypothetical protein IMG5_178390 [Ichthyophthirius multifiliis]EGR28324.1 hypothetical protein IMG5_178390 [Ichthyophthirius multifiliis]|eukprot:XP_004027669.1 hypothetical protein IMG5_178390 [Ichthyophthirius multifiliis]
MKLNIEDHIDEIIEVLKVHIFPLILIFITLISRKQITQTKYESFSFYWYLFNGSIFHMTWSGFICGLRQCEPFLRVFILMDQRYKSQENIVKLVSYVDLLVTGPLCLYTANLFLSQRGLKRDVFCIISSISQILGSVFFVFDEFLNKFANTCKGDCFSFTTENIIYFWIFFVAMNHVWFILPLVHIKKSLIIFYPKKDGNLKIVQLKMAMEVIIMITLIKQPIDLKYIQLAGQGSSCGYCNNKTGSYTYGLTAKKMDADIYKHLMEFGWRRCGDYFYKPDLFKSCCKSYTIRVGVVDITSNGLSSVYFYYEPSFKKYNLAQFGPNQLLCPSTFQFVDYDERVQQLISQKSDDPTLSEKNSPFHPNLLKVRFYN